MKVNRQGLVINVITDEDSTAMKLTDYRDSSKRTAGKCTDDYLLLGLVGESGEVIDVLKKIVRDINNGISVEAALAGRKDKLTDELGDVMWYNVVFHDDLVENNVSFGGVVNINISEAINSALSLTMSCTEFAMLNMQGSKIKTESTLQTVLYGVYDICMATGIDISEVMKKNVDKLTVRYSEGFKLGVK